MIERRQRQLGRVPGFTPIYNVRLHRWIDIHLISLLADVTKKCKGELVALGLPTSPDEAQQEAQRRALRFLPAQRMVRSLAVRPSKSDDPVYRKAAVRGHL